MDYYENGDLFDYVKSAERNFPLNLSQHFFKQICLGVQELHENYISHRDLKLENIILDDEFNVKLIDFGMCLQVESKDDIIFESQGTPNYMAPELFHSYIRSNPFKADIFSLGVVLFILVMGFPPIYE